MECSWKPDWEEAKCHHADWWARRGLVLATGSPPPAPHPHEAVPRPADAASVEARYTETDARAQSNHYRLSRMAFPLDTVPVSGTDIGPGSLALALGSEPGFSPETVWFWPCMAEETHPERLPPLRFDADSRWWQVHERTLRVCAELAAGRYTVGCPDLVENLDILASLRGTQNLLLDMVDRPEWVEEKVHEINAAFYEAYDRVYDIIALADGGAVFWAFGLWGPG